MFIWKASTIIKSFERFLPKMYQYLEAIAASMGTTAELETIKRVYGQIPSVSIDYGVMERSDNVAVILGDFGWSDVGSWDSLGALYDVDDMGKIIKGEQVNINTKNCIYYSENRLIDTISIENMVTLRHRMLSLHAGRIKPRR